MNSDFLTGIKCHDLFSNTLIPIITTFNNPAVIK